MKGHKEAYKARNESNATWLNDEEFKIVFGDAPSRKRKLEVSPEEAAKSAVLRLIPHYKAEDIKSVVQAKKTWVVQLATANCALQKCVHTEEDAQVLVKCTRDGVKIDCSVCPNKTKKNQRQLFLERAELDALFPNTSKKGAKKEEGEDEELIDLDQDRYVIICLAKGKTCIVDTQFVRPGFDYVTNREYEYSDLAKLMKVPYPAICKWASDENTKTYCVAALLPNQEAPEGVTYIY